ncbi:uncharacterized protein LOC121177642 isoform X2 [Toxotes jaculatrix]|uniref:uncharacterized protein LOC121177642 isoform X2 n=1 Tax=Toxotes jaculatrix TaxID=941984 RepID=UPI001B3B1728|nr:uncharacterized protein LOC121177642 isoform X2 [Toxotes jaculatrix]
MEEGDQERRGGVFVWCCCRRPCRGGVEATARAELRTEEGDQQRRLRGVLRSRGELSTARPGRNSGRRRAISREDQEGQVQSLWSQACQESSYILFNCLCRSVVLCVLDCVQVLLSLAASRGDSDGEAGAELRTEEGDQQRRLRGASTKSLVSSMAEKYICMFIELTMLKCCSLCLNVCRCCGVEGSFRRRGRGGTQDGGGRSAEKTKRGAAESRGAFDGEARAELRTEEGDQQRRPRGVLLSLAESRGASDGEARAELRTEEGDQQRRPRGASTKFLVSSMAEKYICIFFELTMLKSVVLCA